MDKNAYLKIEAMHVLDFILSLEGIILKKVNAQDNNIIKNIFQKSLEFLCWQTINNLEISLKISNTTISSSF